MTILCIYNPGSKRGESVTAELRHLLATNTSGHSIEWLPVDDLSQYAGMPDRIGLVGGDGTVNIVMSWLQRTNRQLPIGVIPAGTGNNLAMGLGLSLTVTAAADILVNGTQTMSLDGIAYYQDDEFSGVFVQSAIAGFPAQIACRYDKLRQSRLFRLVARPLGTRIYRILAAISIPWERTFGEWCRAVTVGLPDAEPIDESVIAIFIGNERSLGGDFIPCPDAKIDDGLVDVCLIRSVGVATCVHIFRCIAAGLHMRHAAITYYQSGGPVSLQFERPTALVVDGNVLPSCRHYQFDVLPQRFELLVG